MTKEMSTDPDDTEIVRLMGEIARINEQINENDRDLMIFTGVCVGLPILLMLVAMIGAFKP